MKIGIIGAGFIGSTLAKTLVQHGYEVFISHRRGKDSLQEIADKTGAKAMDIIDIPTKADIVIIAIPQSGILDLPKDLFKEASDSLIIIDTGNYYPLMRDGIIEGLDTQYADTEWTQLQLQRPIIKAFSTIASETIIKGAREKGDPSRIALAIAGDQEAHKQIVMNLVDSIGFDPVDGGSLKDSWRHQPGSEIYCQDLTQAALTQKMKMMGTEKTPALMHEILKAREAEEKMVIADNPDAHYGHPNFKRILDI